MYTEIYLKLTRGNKNHRTGMCKNFLFVVSFMFIFMSVLLYDKYILIYALFTLLFQDIHQFISLNKWSAV